MIEKIKEKYPKLEFANADEKLKEVEAFLQKRPDMLEKFDARLKYLNDYAGDNSKGCQLFADFAPLSFEFTMLQADGSYWFNGGLIYHGQGDTGVGAPTHSVRLGDTHEDWSIHT